MSISTDQIKNYWIRIESKSPPPKYVKKVSVIDFDDLRKNLDQKNNFI